jgi:glycosyltransferase involved in cell wall biosynthesis
MAERRNAASTHNNSPALSVVICTYNRTEMLPACLTSLMNQTVRDRIEVIVIDDGSKQDTASAVADYEVEFEALGTNQGLSAARNAGINRSRAPLVAFTDDDVIVPTNWCELLLEAWNEVPSGTCAIGGAVTVAETTSLTLRYLSRNNPLSPTELDVAQAESLRQRMNAYLLSQSRQDESIRPVYSLVGANMSFSREALAEVGGFDPTIRFGGDEELVCVNLRKKFGDSSVLFFPSIAVAHNFDPRMRDTLRRSFLYGTSNGRNWVRSGGIPGLRPVGGLFVVSLILTAPISVPAAIIVSLLVPFAMWRRWIGASIKERDSELIFYPLIALMQELCTNVGFFVGWQRERRKSR